MQAVVRKAAILPKFTSSSFAEFGIDVQHLFEAVRNCQSQPALWIVQGKILQLYPVRVAEHQCLLFKKFTGALQLTMHLLCCQGHHKYIANVQQKMI